MLSSHKNTFSSLGHPFCTSRHCPSLRGGDVSSRSDDVQMTPDEAFAAFAFAAAYAAGGGAGFGDMAETWQQRDMGWWSFLIRGLSRGTSRRGAGLVRLEGSCTIHIKPWQLREGHQCRLGHLRHLKTLGLSLVFPVGHEPITKAAGHAVDMGVRQVKLSTAVHKP